MTRRYRSPPVSRSIAAPHPAASRPAMLRLGLAVATGLLALAAAGNAPAQQAQRSEDPSGESRRDESRGGRVQPGIRGGERGERQQRPAPAAAPQVAPPVNVNVQRREERIDNRQDRRDDRRDNRQERVEDRREVRDDRREWRTDRRDDRRDDRRYDDRRVDYSRGGRVVGGGGVVRPPVVVNRPLRPPVRVIRTLPPGHRSYAWRGSPYYNYGGYWYRPYGSQFIVTGAPFGLFSPVLPPYYSTLWVGGSRFFFADGTYYTYDGLRRGYVVSRSPYGDDWDDEEDDRGGRGGDDGGLRDEDLYIYPARGQSEQQQADDRYECHRWSVGQTQYDPTQSDYQRDARAEYDRAISACLTGRGYSVK
jgi:hypothetical protein